MTEESIQRRNNLISDFKVINDSNDILNFQIVQVNHLLQLGSSSTLAAMRSMMSEQIELIQTQLEQSVLVV